MRTIAIANHKGGTAKTTTAVSLAAALGELGHRVLVIDMDPQGSASAWLDVRDPAFGVIDAIRGREVLPEHVFRTSAPGVQLIPASPELVVSDRAQETAVALGFIQALEGLPEIWDFVLVDCPPSLGYLSIAPLTVCQEVLIPVETHALAMAGITSLQATIARTQNRLNPELKIAGVLACRTNRTTHSRKVIERLTRRFPMSMLQAQIRENIRLAEAPAFRLPITIYAPDSTGAEDYRALAAELAGPPQLRVRPAVAPAPALIPGPMAIPQAHPVGARWSSLAARFVPQRTPAELIEWLAPLAILGLAGFVRLWQIDAVGFNTDEAVYSGQAAALANAPDLTPFFPIFRAHPLLFQFTLAGVFSLTGVSDVAGRVVAAALGVLTVFLVLRLGQLMYSRTVGLMAALFMALMPYHVIVTRQVLLDGPMTLFATLALYTVARYALGGGRVWLYASGAAIGLTFLSKETGGILLGAIFAFFAITPQIPVRVRDLLGSLLTFLAVTAAFPLALILAGAGGGTTAQQYLVWQLFRRPNHDAAFYLLTVPEAIGPLVLLGGLMAIILNRHRLDWRERLLLTWVAVTVAFFELWPVKGFQYLLPAAPPLAVLAARGIVSLARSSGPSEEGGIRMAAGRLDARMGPIRGATTSATQLGRRIGRVLAPFGSRQRAWALAAIVALSLSASTVPRIEAASSVQVLAGTGGIPGGREAGTWIRDNTPSGAKLMTIGPSMANVVQFYGQRKAYGLSISPNPLKRNPSYDPIVNPDLQIRSNELQYAVWDAYSAARSAYFESKLLDYVDRYHGRAVHTESVPGPAGGQPVSVIIVYEVRP